MAAVSSNGVGDAEMLHKLLTSDPNDISNRNVCMRLIAALARRDLVREQQIDGVQAELIAIRKQAGMAD